MPLVVIGIIGLVIFLIVKLVALTTIAFGLDPKNLADFGLVWCVYGVAAKILAVAANDLMSDWEDDTLSVFQLSAIGPLAFFGILCALGDSYLLSRMEQSSEKKI